jgi:hypothetical protein
MKVAVALFLLSLSTQVHATLTEECRLKGAKAALLEHFAGPLDPGFVSIGLGVPAYEDGDELIVDTVYTFSYYDQNGVKQTADSEIYFGLKIKDAKTCQLGQPEMKGGE